MIIGVIGGNRCDDEVCALAYEVGREIGRSGHTLICGGCGGVMREACRGARETGGTTIGILPGTDLSEMNEFVDYPIITGLGHARNVIIVRTADALIAVGGRYGTLSEIAFGLVLDKPIAGLGTWDLREPDGAVVPVQACATAVEAVAYCDSAVAR